MFNKLTRTSLPLLLAFVLVACSTTEEKDEYADYSVQQMYAEAKEQMNNASYEAAIKIYEKLQSRFPFGSYAQQAELDVAYAHYKAQEMDLAIIASENFIKAHPNHPNVDYAYYIKGLANYNDNRSPLSFIYDQDLSNRDPRASSIAFDTFKELVTRFPDSRYAKDSAERMNNLVNALANNQLHIARYYMERRAPLAAVNRAQTVVYNYQDTPAVEEALSIMIKGYGMMNLPDLQNDAIRVLKKNFPSSTYLPKDQRAAR